jgi:hypothetical protein
MVGAELQDASSAPCALTPPRIGLLQDVHGFVSDVIDRTSVVKSKPATVHTGATGPKSMALAGMNIVGADARRRDLLPPVGRVTVRPASSDLDDEASAAPVELHGQEIDPRRTDPAEMGE